MKHAFTFLLGGALSLLLGGRPAQAQSYQLVWADEFTTGISADWQFETGNNNGWGNNERQYYQAANARVVNGELQITARRENVGGAAYTSARMKTQGRREFRYGRIEARLKLPLGQGLWPAFWLLGSNINSVSWPACGEIDVMEHINAENKVYGTVHWDNNGHAEYGGNLVTSPQDYHVYAIEWDASYIRWFVDGTKYHEILIANNAGGTEEFQRPFFLLLNLAVGGNWPGQRIDESKLPATMYVDYVRVYQKVNALPARFIEAESYSAMRGVQVESCAEGGQDVGYLDAGDWLAYNTINFPVSGNYLIEYRVASPGGATLSADLNAGSIQLGSTTIPATGGWQNWRTVSRTVYISAGTYNFGLFAQTSGWNINWLRITPPATAARAAAVTAAAGPATPPAGALLVYPNPQTGAGPLTIQLPASPATPATVQVLDAAGREVWRTTTQAASIEVAPGRRLPSGLYLIQVTGAAGKSTQKLIVE